MKKIIISSLLLGTLISFSSCSDSALEPTLEQSKDLDTNIKTDGDLNTVLLGGYNRMQHSSYYGRDIVIFGEVRSDNAFSNAKSNRFVTVGRMNMLITDAYASSAWSQIYKTISSANIVINKPASGVTGDANKVRHIQGEAYMMRALGHFDLLRVYGQQFIAGQGGMAALGVPYVTTFRETAGAYPSRQTVQQNYDAIMKDLDSAIALMDASYDSPSKHYFTGMAAHALKARIALYFKQYALAEQEAALVVNSGKYTIATAANYLSTFNTDSTGNVIFAVDFNSTDNNGSDSMANIYRGSYGDIVILKDLFDAYGAGDIRKTSAFIAPNGASTVEYRNIGKYPNVSVPSDDVPVLRIEEIVLIYAEALLHNGKPAEALVQLNKIPANRNAAPYAVATDANILLERRKELAFEGFRFDDIARTGMNMPLVDPVRQTFGTVNFGDYNYAFPIPNAEVGANSNMKQNKGY
ncbi:SusD family protein [Elizabethkingia miricola]|nr:SusD family protein [Elizabethkingia miricola]